MTLSPDYGSSNASYQNPSRSPLQQLHRCGPPSLNMGMVLQATNVQTSQHEQPTMCGIPKAC